MAVPTKQKRYKLIESEGYFYVLKQPEDDYYLMPHSNTFERWVRTYWQRSYKSRRDAIRNLTKFLGRKPNLLQKNITPWGEIDGEIFA